MKRGFVILMGLVAFAGGLWAVFDGSQNDYPPKEDLQAVAIDGEVEFEEVSGKVRFEIPEYGKTLSGIGAVEKIKGALKRPTSKQLLVEIIEEENSYYGFFIFEVSEISDGQKTSICSYEETITALKANDRLGWIFGWVTCAFGIFFLLAGTFFTNLL